MAREKDMFGDVEFYQAKEKAKARFNKILGDLRLTVRKNGYAVQTIERFRPCLNASGSQSESLLPFYSATPDSRKHNKIQCVLCLVSHTMQSYWDFCEDGAFEELVNSRLDELENIAAKGLAAFKVAGTTPSKGYYLKEIE